MSVTTLLGSGAGEVRRYAEAERWLRETVASCTERDIDTLRSYSLAWLARIEFEQGRWPQQAADMLGAEWRKAQILRPTPSQ